MKIAIAFALLVQEPSAEETFKKIEESIARARTLSVQFKLESQSEARKLHSCSGMLLAKEGNRLRFELKGDLGRFKLYRSVVADGTTLVVDHGQGVEKREEVPKGLREDVNALLSRSGICIDFFGAGVSKPGGAKRPREAYLVSDFKREKDDQGGGTLTYKLKVAGGPQDEPWSVRLWHDSDFRPTRRSLVTRFQGVQTVIMETYTGFTVDSDIPDEKFKLPAEK